MHTTVIVVTHQSAAVLAPCLQALAGLRAVTAQVVDNASADGSADLARRLGASVLALERNLGFAAAANRSARRAPGGLLCFLNPDCVLTAETLEAARTALAGRPRACAVPDFAQDGAVVPGRQPGYTWRKVLADLMENNRRSPDLALRFRNHPAYHDPRWHWPLGTCLFAHADFFRAVGGFDERYFLYMEDVELGWRWHRGGGEVLALPTRVAHGGMQGAAIPSPERLRLLNRARVQFARRHYGPLIGLWARSLVRP